MRFIYTERQASCFKLLHYFYVCFTVQLYTSFCAIYLKQNIDTIC